jgi:hypothetical protein
MKSTLSITDINLFEATGGTGFSADVRINNEFSLQLGNDDCWSFAPEAESAVLDAFCDDLRGHGCGERTGDWFAEQLAETIGARAAVEAAAKNEKNWL